jgi:hypothetical protein
MESIERSRRVRLTVMLMVAVGGLAVCLLALMWVNAPAASA